MVTERQSPTISGAVHPVDVVLPCLDEAAALPWVLERIPVGYRAIVADNGSTDGSAELARALGAQVVDVPVRGYGAAVHAGLLAARAPVVCVCDADASLDPTELPRLVAPVAAGEADLVVGRRRAVRREVWPLHARTGNAIVAHQLRRRGGVPVRDIGPMRAARREALLALGVVDRRFGYPLELLARAAAADWRIEEVDVAYLPRRGRSKVTGTALGTARAVRDMSAVLRSMP
ncbi:glycosyltransferase [Frankia sp. CcI49]|uniref:glycosyltransferase family 2 protein n=1 Tax=Frankia sp. CcI49 TaxID=1745382 RepID=UPI0009789652|nr:glycosyltransferase family 2 protein [Frankia sp. CcI49]ONH51691.1 glycosyltransferase [Frankia sp. CcI49]